ncbi:hypothetical protein [Mediannikoviicoccus vaginalis]|uniref:hypothetical protein n=1 Tax=Mediannikoviicoccus vaginalis TaxID=2899727 RepID=UPI001F3257B6|nr:hypothetical protein [Mediannikoviicoccus vaginalis]
MKFFYIIWGINLIVWIISITMGYYLENIKTNEEEFKKLDQMFGAYLSRFSLALLPIIILSIFLSRGKSDIVVAIVGAFILLLQIALPSMLILLFLKSDSKDDRKS